MTVSRNLLVRVPEAYATGTQGNQSSMTSLSVVVPSYHLVAHVCCLAAGRSALLRLFQLFSSGRCCLVSPGVCKDFVLEEFPWDPLDRLAT